MTDELMHPVGNDPAWSESYYFNFVDPKTSFGMFTRVGFRPGNGWADALHAVFLGGNRVAFTYGRRDIGKDLALYNGDLKVGGLTITCEDPHKRWKIVYNGPAQDIEDGAILLTRSKMRAPGWFKPAHLTMEIEFEMLTQPHFAARGAQGHFEQSGRVNGWLTLGDEKHTLEGFGVRDKSWGPRNWSGRDPSKALLLSTPAAPNPFVVWFSMNFGPEMSMGGLCERGADGVMRCVGWMQEGVEVGNLTDVVIESTFRPNSILHTGVVLSAKTPAGNSVRIDGVVEGMCPTKIPFAGGVTAVNEGLVRYRLSDGRQGAGIAEEWHNVVE